MRGWVRVIVHAKRGGGMMSLVGVNTSFDIGR